MSDSAEAHRRARLRSRRGLLELDLILVPFAREAYSQMTGAEQEAYDELLAEDDVVLLDWLKGETCEDARAREMVNRIRDWHFANGRKS